MQYIHYIINLTLLVQNKNYVEKFNKIMEIDI